MSVLSHEESLKHNHASEKAQEIVEVVIEIPDSEKHKPSKKKEKAKKEEPATEATAEEAKVDEQAEEDPAEEAKKSKK